MERVSELANVVREAALKMAHLEKAADLAHLARESLLRMSPLSSDDRILEDIKRAQFQTCESLDILKSIAKKEYDEANEKFKNALEEL